MPRVVRESGRVATTVEGHHPTAAADNDSATQARHLIHGLGQSGTSLILAKASRTVLSRLDDRRHIIRDARILLGKRTANSVGNPSGITN